MEYYIHILILMNTPEAITLLYVFTEERGAGLGTKFTQGGTLLSGKGGTVLLASYTVYTV